MKTEVRNGINVLIEVLNGDLRDGTFTVPNEVSAIGNRAFDACRENLTRVNMPQVTTIEDSAFKDCNALTQVYMPKATSIGKFAFSNCSALTQVHMPKATTIELSAFSSCTALTQVDMPNATSIGRHAFSNCSALTQVNMPKATRIGMCAFYKCRALTQVDMPKAITIELSAFSWCTALTQVDMPKATTIEQKAFFWCSALTRVNMPKATTIERHAFSWCTALTRVDMPKAISIGACAFGGCNALTQVYMPNATSIEEWAFGGCNALTQVYMPNATSIEEWAFWNCSALTQVDMPKATTIGNEAFSNCSALTHIIASNIDAEAERVRALLPAELRRYVLSKLAAEAQQQAINEFCLGCLELVDAKAPSKGRIHLVLLPAIFEFLGKNSDFLSSFTKKMLQVPYPANSSELDGYNQKIKKVGEEYLEECKQKAECKPQTEREAVAYELEKYIYLLRRANPNSFLATQEARSKQSEEHRTLHATLQKIIHFLQRGIPISLSAEEKEMITKRKTLLQKISPKIQKELGINPKPAPLPVAEDRDAQENRALLDEIDRILEELSDKIQGIGTHYQGASQAATELHFALRQARDSLKSQLESGVNKRQAILEFQGCCEQLVAAAMPELEQDKDLYQYLCDMLKSLANLFIGVARKLGSRTTFFNTSSESSQSIIETRQELISVISPL